MIKAAFIRIFALYFLGTALPAWAKWATLSDAYTQRQQYRVDIDVHKDGSATQLYEIQEKILKEQGRSKWVNHIITYNENQSTIKILQAYTKVDGKIYPLLADKIEDKPLASSAKGFDQQHQILLAFPKVKLGAEVYLKVQMITQPQLPNHFESHFDLGSDTYVENAKIHIHSALPLIMEINDPHASLVSKKNGKTSFTEMTVTQVKPIYTQTVGENFFVNAKHLTWFNVSSTTTWLALVEKMLPHYQQVINQSLPSSFAAIEAKARSAKDAAQAINTVTSALAEILHYMGDWKSVKGRYFPHNLAEIAATGLADCKDYTVATAAILQRLGFHVTPALVLRGEQEAPPPDNIPSLTHFNHVLVKAVKAGKTYWVDPTNAISMADGIFPDIANKPVLLLNNSSQPLARVPEVDYKHNKVVRQSTWDLQFDNTLIQQGDIALYGEAASALTAAQLFNSDASIQEIVFKSLGNEFLEADKKIKYPNLTSRVVKDLKLNFYIRQPLYPVKTNKGDALMIPMLSAIRDYVAIDPTMVSDSYFGSPRTMEVELLLQHYQVNLATQHNLDVQISSPWVDIIRKVETRKAGIVIHDTVIRKQALLVNHSLQSAAFKQLQNKIHQQLESVVLIGKRSLT